MVVSNKPNLFEHLTKQLKALWTTERGTSGLYYKHITFVNYDSSIINKYGALNTDDARVVIYDRHMFIATMA